MVGCLDRAVASPPRTFHVRSVEVTVCSMMRRAQRYGRATRRRRVRISFHLSHTSHCLFFKHTLDSDGRAFLICWFLIFDFKFLPFFDPVFFSIYQPKRKKEKQTKKDGGESET
jgi:hypothetical protein